MTQKRQISSVIIIGFIMVIGISFLLSQHKSSYAQQDNFKIFDSKTANFEIKYPSDWKQRGDQKITDEVFRLFGKRIDAFIMLESPQKTTNPQLPSEVELGRKLSKAEKQVFIDEPQAFFNIYVSNTTKHLDTNSMTVKSSSAFNEFSDFKNKFGLCSLKT